MTEDKDVKFYTTDSGKVAFIPSEKTYDGAGGTHKPSEAEIQKLSGLGIYYGLAKNDIENPNTIKVVKVNMDADIQKQFDRATPKERQNIAFRYIMDNLRGKYPAEDGRVVAIEKVGADKISHTLNETKIRVIPELAKLIEAGKLEGVVEAKKEGEQPHKLFTHFAYYNVPFKIGAGKIKRWNTFRREQYTLRFKSV